MPNHIEISLDRASDEENLLHVINCAESKDTASKNFYFTNEDRGIQFVDRGRGTRDR